MIDQQLVDTVRTLEPEMLAFLEAMVLVQSGSRNKEGVDAVSRLIESRLAGLDLCFERERQAELGDHLIIRTRATAKTDRQILLLGHMDTVFPADTDFIEFRQDDSRVYGPGVCDMKGGLVAAFYAMKALGALGLLSGLPITMVCNSDEEIGSPTSRNLIRREAAKSVFAFVMEAGGAGGEVVTGRKGNMVLELLVNGAAGHAAFVGAAKTSAVLELAHQIVGLEALNDPVAGISVNVGLVRGGIGHNTVPATASALVDFRFIDAVQQTALQEAVAALTATPTIKGTRVTAGLRSERPAMPECAANIELFAVLTEVAKELGMPVRSEYRFGVSDANIVAQQGVPVLDGLGPIGGDDHSSSEYMITASLAQRTCLLAGAIKRCWQKRGADR